MSNVRKRKFDHPETSTGQSEHAADANKFAEGSVVRIKLTDFVTYSNVELRPGPNLNVIIGPNGTGKSTVVCAICLGLGGKTAFLGRSLQVSDYIRHGARTAVIEVELFNEDGDNYVVKREISKNNTSQWHVNGRTATQKSVEELINRLNIQLGNLCQFLPQDKVADFAKMSQVELLENTEKAGGSAEMYETHLLLKTARDKHRQLLGTYQRTGERLESQTSLNARLEQDVQNYEQRKQHLEKVDQLVMKKAWVLYQNQVTDLQNEREKKKILQEKIQNATRHNAPLKNALEEAKRNVQKLEREMKAKQEEIRKNANQATVLTKKIEDETDQLRDVQDELRHRRQEEEARKRKLNNLLDQLRGLEADFSNLQEENVQPALERISDDIRSLSQDINKLQRSAEICNQERGTLNQEVQGLQSDLRQLQDVTNQRLNLLRRYNKDAYDAVQWLKTNKHKLTHEIFGPLQLVINVKKPHFAKYVESHVAARDMCAFVCQDKDDMNTFLKTLRDEQRLKINAILMPPEPADTFKPQQPIQRYSNYNFLCYMQDVFTCPEPVMRQLCKLYRVHNIPIGTKRTRDIAEKVIRELPQFNNFYTENYQYSIKKSKYSDATSTRCTELRQPSLLTVTSDTAREAEIRQILMEKQTKLQDKQSECQQKQNSLRAMEKQMDELRNKKKVYTEKKNMRVTLQQRINTKKQGIERLQQEEVDLQEEERKTHNKIKVINNKKCQILLTLTEKIKICIVLGKEKVRLSLQYGSANQNVTAAEGQLREQSSTLQKLQQELKIGEESISVMKKATQKLLAEAKKITSTGDNEELSDSLVTSFKGLPKTIEEIDAKIHEEQARADCTFSADESIIREYKQRTQEIARLQKDHGNHQEQIQKHQAETEKLREQWLTPLKELISRISERFSYYFRAMNCAGQIELSVPENEEDYEKYGIAIKVKFRDTEQLRDLTAHRQSGGEKSVSTVLYMMALQEMTHVPFRCVDEINQGMDPENERRVFELVVKTACQENNSQYFLLTPKLLPNLSYGHKMTVLCVYNSKNMLSHQDWQLKKFIKRRSRLLTN